MSKIPRAEWAAILARHAGGETITKIAQGYGCTAPAIHYILKRQRQSAEHGEADRRRAPTPPIHIEPPRTPPAADGASATPRHEIRRPPAASDGSTLQDPILVAEPRADRNGRDTPAFPRPIAGPRKPALAAALDAQLYDEAEAAVAEFRASFDAALAENAAGTRERLRQAASDLMRMAARTTIVLDRLGAAREAAAPGRDDPYPGWAERRFGG